MNEILLVVLVTVFVFFLGYDSSSYRMMRIIDPTYNRRNKWFLGYNTYHIWKSSRCIK